MPSGDRGLAESLRAHGLSGQHRRGDCRGAHAAVAAGGHRVGLVAAVGGAGERGEAWQPGCHPAQCRRCGSYGGGGVRPAHRSLQPQCRPCLYGCGVQHADGGLHVGGVHSLSQGTRHQHPHGSAAGLRALLRHRHAWSYGYRDGHRGHGTHPAVAPRCFGPHPHPDAGHHGLAERLGECRHPAL